MKRSSFCKVLLMASLGISASNASALESGAQSRGSATVDVLVAEILQTNPELKFYQAEIAAAKGGLRAAGLRANPELSSSVGRKTIESPGLGTEGLAWSASVVQPFEWPGRMGLRKAIANRDLDLAELGLRRFRNSLTGKARTLAYGLLGARQKAAAAREVAERFQALREVLVQREPAGLTPLLETRVIEATELTMQRRSSEATLAMRTALFGLNRLRGEGPNAPLLVQSTDLVFRPVESAEILVGQARTNNFEVRLRAVELAQQGFRADLAKNERFPTISVGPSLSEERAGDRERIIGLSLSLPLPLWNRNAGNIEAAKARQMQAEVSLNLTLREVERQVFEAALTYETKLREMAKWRPDSVRHFQEAAEVADRHYRLGAVPISTYVELQKQYLEAVDALLDTKGEALEAAVQLELLTGVVLPLFETTTTEDVR